MKLRLLILLAAALAAAPAAGQTIKSLGYNTTNGQVVYSGTNTLRMPDQVKFGTNSAGIVSGSQYLTLLDGGGGVAMQLGTNRITVYDEIDFGGISGTALSNAATTRTNFGLGGTNTVTFSNLQLNSFPGGGSGGFVGRNNTQLALYGTNVSSSQPAFYGWDGFNNAAMSAGTSRTNLGLPGTWLTNTDVTNFRTAIELGATNNVTFSNITVGGTLGVTGNATLSGVNNTMPGATNAASASSLMTRELTDTRMVDYIMQQPARFRNLSHSIQSYISGTGAAVHAGPIAEGRVNTRIVNGSTNSFAGIRVNRQGPWNGIEGNFGIEWARPMNVVVTGSKAISTNNVTRAFLVLGGGISDFDLPTNGNFVALNWTNSTNAQVIVGRAGVLTTNATIISTSASANFAIWIDHSTNGIGQIYYAEKSTGSNVQKPASPSASYTNGPAVTSDAGQISLNFGTVGLVTNTGGSFELVGLNNAIMFAP